MNYKIIAADAALGQIQVAYSHLGEHIATMAIDVPIVNGEYLTGAALVAEINALAPLWLLNRKRAVAVAAGFSGLLALVEAPPVVAPVVAPQTQWELTTDATDVTLQAALQRAMTEAAEGTV